MSNKNPHFKVHNPETREMDDCFVYDQVTGELIFCFPVDRAEMLKQQDGRYALTPAAEKGGGDPAPMPPRDDNPSDGAVLELPRSRSRAASGKA